jgi:hypothetical protein
MIDWEKYDPARDADEEESHLCNSLNAEFGFIRHLIADPNLTGVKYVPIAKTDLEHLADYGFRAQAVITYLQEKVKGYYENS